MSALVPHSVEVAYFWAALVTLVAVGCALTRGAVRTYRAGGAHTAEEHCLTKATRPLPERKSTPIARSSVVWVHVLTSLVANLTSLLVVVLVARPDAADLPAGFGPPAAGWTGRNGLVASAALFALAVAGSAGSLPAKAAIMTSVPDQLRGRVGGVGATGLNIPQLLPIIAAAAAAEVLAATTVVALAGAVTLVAMAALWRHLSPYLREDDSPAATSTTAAAPHRAHTVRALQEA